MRRIRHRHHTKSERSIRFAGRVWPVIDTATICRRRYLILKKIGSGDRTRFLAFDPHAGPNGDLRGLMILPRNRSTRQYIRVLKRISSRTVHLPTILDYEQKHDEILVVLNWVHGPSLLDYLDEIRNGRRPAISTTESFRLYRGLAHGLSQLHRRHTIVHGDIKPANLIVARDPSRLVMIDYGSAWLMERTTGRNPGDGMSYGYGAPEIHAGVSLIDQRSDQFSASVVLYEMLTMALPYDNLGGLAGRSEFVDQMRGKLIVPSKLTPDPGQLPRELRAAIDRVTVRGLALDPDERYPTCHSWLNDINSVFVRMQPISRISAFNSAMTRVIDWLVNRFTRRETKDSR